MQVEAYLKEHQPIVYQTFVRALETGKLSHAYLLSGAPGTPLLEVARFMAKSILCDDPSPCACNNCITCLRFDDDNYPDFIFFDGSRATIKKDEIGYVEEQFQKTAFESKGIMVYVIHLVENMTVEAVNSILKFLEEPGKNVHAFLTTNNENNVLPTIISRCQLLRLNPVDRSLVIEESVGDGIDKEDAELLSYFYNSPELIQEALADEDTSGFYQQAKNAFLDLLQSMQDDVGEAVFYTESRIVPMLRSKESARYFLDMLIMGYEDMINIKHDKSPFLESYDTILTDLAYKLPHIEDSLIEILKCRNMVGLNLNIPLLLDHIIITITEVKEQ